MSNLILNFTFANVNSYFYTSQKKIKNYTENKKKAINSVKKIDNFLKKIKKTRTSYI